MFVSIGRLVAPQFPMVGMAVPEEIRLTVDGWLAMVEREIEHATPPRGMRDIADLPALTEGMLREVMRK